MATETFVPLTSTSMRTTTDQLILMAATTLTTTPTVTTNTVKTAGWEYVIIRLAYVKGSETTARFYLEGYDGTSWSPIGIKAAVSSGLSAVTKDVITLTPADYAASDSILLPPVSVIGLQQIRGYIYYAGGSAPGTLAVTATAAVTVKTR